MDPYDNVRGMVPPGYFTPAPPFKAPVSYADSEEEAQRLEAQMGMVPPAQQPYPSPLSADPSLIHSGLMRAGLINAPLPYGIPPGSGPQGIPVPPSVPPRPQDSESPTDRYNANVGNPLTWPTPRPPVATPLPPRHPQMAHGNRPAPQAVPGTVAAPAAPQGYPDANHESAWQDPRILAAQNQAELQKLTKPGDGIHAFVGNNGLQVFRQADSGNIPVTNSPHGPVVGYMENSPAYQAAMAQQNGSQVANSAPLPPPRPTGVPGAPSQPTDASLMNPQAGSPLSVMAGQSGLDPSSPLAKFMGLFSSGIA